ncbi:MAG: Rpn family recombination-promoting nuclease/putative transposase, partial [bacterium]
MMTIHDSGYRKLFSNKVIFRQLIETFVNEDWVKDLDFEDCETVDKSFISDHYKETESDIIYKLKLKDKEVYFFILIEFQSTVERFMALRVLNYVTNFYMDYIESNPKIKMLPAMFPILLYNGDADWTAPVKLGELIEDHERLGRFSISFEYFKIAENEYKREDLLQIKNIVSTLFLAESYYNIDLLKEELLELFDRESDKEAVSLFLNW